MGLRLGVLLIPTCGGNVLEIALHDELQVAGNLCACFTHSSARTDSVHASVPRATGGSMAAAHADRLGFRQGTGLSRGMRRLSAPPPAATHRTKRDTFLHRRMPPT